MGIKTPQSQSQLQSRAREQVQADAAAPITDNGVTSLLLVDDDSVLAGLWQTYLQRLGYRVDCCGTVADAEILLQSNSYQLLIVDLFLRENGRILEEGGVTLINRVRLNRNTSKTSPPPIAVLAVTGAPARSAGKFSAVDSIQNLTDGILHKPVRLEELSLEVRRLVTDTV